MCSYNPHQRIWAVSAQPGHKCHPPARRLLITPTISSTSSCGYQQPVLSQLCVLTSVLALVSCLVINPDMSIYLSISPCGHVALEIFPAQTWNLTRTPHKGTQPLAFTRNSQVSRCKPTAQSERQPARPPAASPLASLTLSGYFPTAFLLFSIRMSNAKVPSCFKNFCWISTVLIKYSISIIDKMMAFLAERVSKSFFSHLSRSILSSCK